MKILLASASPRRKAIMREIADSFEVVLSSFEEKVRGLSPRETALAFARGKAQEVFSRHSDCLVIGADTVVALDGEMFGKPHDGAEARNTLHRLSGKTHVVYTGVCVMREGLMLEDVGVTEVTFKTLTDEEIEAYVAKGLPFGKAGAYGIQDGCLVEKIKGSYSNVVGLPVKLTQGLLEKAL